MVLRLKRKKRKTKKPSWYFNEKTQWVHCLKCNKKLDFTGETIGHFAVMQCPKADPNLNRMERRHARVAIGTLGETVQAVHIGRLRTEKEIQKEARKAFLKRFNCKDMEEAFNKGVLIRRKN